MWLGAPVALYLWTLGGPFISDDLLLVLKSERYIRGESDQYELYRFAATDQEWARLRDRGTIPWWLPESGRLDFFRPLAELVFYLDVLLFKRNILGHRLTSLGVLIAALLSVHWLFMRASGGDKFRAGVATFYFGISQTIAPPVTWMCNRQDMLVVIGVSLAAGAYWAAGQESKNRYLFAAIGATAFALLAKEVAVSLAGVLLVHELIQRWPAAKRRERPMAGIIAISVVLMTAVYLSYYLWSRPWAFQLSGGDGEQSQLSSQLPISLLLYSAVWTVGFPIDILLNASREQVLAVAAAGGLFTAMVLLCLRRNYRSDGSLLFFLLWAGLFMVPGLRSLTPSARMLCTATVGWSYLLASLIFPTGRTAVPVPHFLRHWLFAANGITSIACVIATVLVMNHAERAACERLERIVAETAKPLADGDEIIIENADSIFEILCAGDRLEFLTGRRDVGVHFLKAPGDDAEVFRQDDATIVMSSKGSSLLAAPFHRLTLGEDWRPENGESFGTRRLTAVISKLNEQGLVSEIRFNHPSGSAARPLHFHPLALNPTAEIIRAADSGALP